MTLLTDEPLNFQLVSRPVRSSRIEQMLGHVNSVPAGICLDRVRSVTNSYRETEPLPQIVRRARALERTLRELDLYLLPRSLLVGGQASRPNYSPLFPEFTVDFLEKELFERDPFYPPERPADRFVVDEGSLEELRELLAWWHGRTHKERVYAALPEDAVTAQDSVGAVNIVNFLHGGDGHFAPPYRWLMKRGLRTLIEECAAKRSELDLASVEGMDSARFYDAVSISLEAVIAWAHRYADLVEAEAKKAEDAGRRAELLDLASICRRVPEYPARTFHEALQFVTFVQFAIQIEDNAQGICPGRFDQELIDWYRDDIAAGRLTRERALELVQNFFVMLSVIERIRSWEDTDFFRGKPIFQNMTIGGIDPDTGEDGTNELSYLVLDAIEHTRTVQPSHYVRWHETAPERFKMRVAEVVRLGTGFPAIANDGLYIPAMLNRGYTYRDAADYCIVGCAEPGVAGMRAGRTGAAWLCIAKVLDMALNNGYDTRTGVTLNPNPSGKDLATFASWDEVWGAFDEQLRYYIRTAVLMDNITDRLWEEFIEEPLSSVFSCPETTIERGRSLKKGGAKYDFSGNETIGLANVANGLYAVKKLVFEDQTITGAALLHALRTDFSDSTTDPTGPEIQQLCLAVPKYGNDIDAVDFIARDVLALVSTEFPKHPNTRHGRGPIGGVFQASTTTVSSNTPFGRITGPLPDGRKRGSPLSDGQSPMRGTDTRGPTAAMRSVGKLRNVLLSEGSLYNLKLLPQDLKD